MFLLFDIQLLHRCYIFCIHFLPENVHKWLQMKFSSIWKRRLILN